MTDIEKAQPRITVPLVGELNDLDQAMRYAQVMAMADILPTDLRNKAANVLLIILYGQQLKIPPAIAIQTIYVVKGRPVMSGKLLLSKVREAGHRASVLEHTDTSCTVKITRGDTGEEHTETYTLDDAVAAKLVSLKEGKPYARSKSGEALPWETWTKRMLLWRAAGFCADFICPEVRMGFAIEGEMDTLPDEDRPTLAQVAAEREDTAPKETPADPPAPADDAEVAAIVADIEREHTPAEQAPTAASDVEDELFKFAMGDNGGES